MTDTPPSIDPFDYMEELSEAYKEAFSKRIAGRATTLSEEKRERLIRYQKEIRNTARRLVGLFRAEEKRELAQMLEESAEESLRILGSEDNDPSTDPTLPSPLSVMLAKATLLGNRCVNFLVRHSDCNRRLFYLFSSELYALYAIAALN